MIPIVIQIQVPAYSLAQLSVIQGWETDHSVADTKSVTGILGREFSGATQEGTD